MEKQFTYRSVVDGLPSKTIILGSHTFLLQELNPNQIRAYFTADTGSWETTLFNSVLDRTESTEIFAEGWVYFPFSGETIGEAYDKL